MYRNIIKIIGVFVLLQFTVACTAFSPTLGPEAAPESKTGYVYGRFTLVHSSTGASAPPIGSGHLIMGLGLEEQTGRSVIIPFELSTDPSVIAVKPGTYVVKKLVFLTQDQRSPGDQIFPKSLLTKPFVVEPGKAYYLLDFVAESLIVSGVGIITSSWRLKSIEDNYDSTTMEFKRKFLNFRDVEVERALKTD